MKLQLLRIKKEAKTPTYGSEGSACFDLYAAEEVAIKPGETKLIPLGYAMGIPEGWEVMIRPRSGMSLKTGLRMPNSPGTIDSDYRGEVTVILHNTSSENRVIQIGDRIAQASPRRVEKTSFAFVDFLSPTDRDSGGLGSTGV